MQNPYLPDNWVSEDLLSDETWAYACTKFKTHFPTDKQLNDSQDEIEENLEAYVQDVN